LLRHHFSLSSYLHTSGGGLRDLKYGVYAILAFSGFCFLWILSYVLLHRNNLKEFLYNTFTVGFFAYIFFTVIMLWGHSGRLLENWDEFAHWGATVKGMYYNDFFSSYRNAPILAKHSGYPPATALLHYFFTKCAGTYEESNIIRSMGVFAFSLILPVFEHVQLKRNQLLHAIACFVIFLFLPTLIYSDFYVTLYVDGIVGVLFAYMLYTYFSARKLSLINILRLSGAAFVITMVKFSGAVFAMIAIGIIFLMNYISGKKMKTIQRW